MPGTWTYTESTNTVVVTGGTSGSPADFASFVAADRTVATSACTIASGAQLKAAAAVGVATDITLTYPVRPVEFKGLRLAITTAQAGGAAVSGDEAVNVYGTTPIWCYMTGASASGQKVVPVANLTHLFQVGDTVVLIDISAPATYETDVIASISEGVSITLTNDNANSYAALDVVGIYQTENINLSAAFGTYWTTLSYGQIAKFSFAGFDGTNTAKVDQPIWGVVSSWQGSQYRIDAKFSIGNASTSTYFTSTDNEEVYFADGCWPYTTANSTLQLGSLDGSYSGQGVMWNFPSGGTTNAFGGNSNTANIVCYNSKLHFRGDNLNLDATTPTRTFYESLISSSSISYYLLSYSSSLRFRRCYLYNLSSFQIGNYAPTEFDNTQMHKTTYGFYPGVDVGDAHPVLTDFLVTSFTNDVTTWNWSGSVTLRDPLMHITAPLINIAGLIYEQYSCNIHVSDGSGNNLSGVSVACEDQFASAAFTTQTTAADGTITEQYIYYKSWTTVSETLTTYSPHKFTLSKTGYETLVLENITVDGPIDWHLELQPDTVIILPEGEVATKVDPETVLQVT